jgi:peptidyl-prolyl cis-trans isomerase D
MLYVMRNQMKSFVMWIIIGAFVTTIFVAWGVGNARRGRDNQNWVAKVGEEAIPLADYEKELRQMEAQLQDFPAELLKSLNLKEQALDRLINRRLFKLEAERLGLSIPDEELAASIQNVPGFQQNGVFSGQVYRAFLAQNRITPAAFEQGIRSDLRISRVNDLIQDSVKVSDAEVYEKYVEQNEKIVVEYVLIKPDDHKPEREPSEEALAEYYGRHKDQWRKDEQINAIFAYITPDHFFDEIDISNETVEKYYTDNRTLYVQPQQVRARHILIRLPKDADAETAEQLREKIDSLLEKAKSGEDFAGLAEANSEDSTASRGGDLGFFERGAMVKEFEEAAFGLEPGEISPVIETRFGYHIIKLEEKQEEQIKKLDEVRDSILRELRFEPGLRLARKNAMRHYNAIRKGKGFRETLKDAGMDLRETGYFSRGDSQVIGVPSGLVQTFKEESFAAGETGLGGVIRGERGYILLKIEDRKPPAIPELAEVRTEVKDVVRAELAKAEAVKVAERMAAAMESNGSFGEVAAKIAGADIEETRPFSRNEHLLTPDFTKTAFSVSSEKPYAFLETEDGVYFVHLKSTEPADEARFADAKEGIRQELVSIKRNGVLSGWLQQARKAEKVEVNRDLLDRT